MSYLVWLVPIALGMGLVGLAAFLWSMSTGQMEDLDGAAERVLLAQDSPVYEREDKAMPDTMGNSNRSDDDCTIRMVS